MKYLLALVLLLVACAPANAQEAATGTPSVDDLLEQIRATATAEQSQQQAVNECYNGVLAEEGFIPPADLHRLRLACERYLEQQGYSERTRQVLLHLEDLRLRAE